MRAEVNGHEVAILIGHEDGTVDEAQQRMGGYAINGCCFSPDGLYILSGARDQELKLWNARTGEEIATLYGYEGGINDCAFSPDGRRMVSAAGGFGRGELKVWEVCTRREIANIKSHSGGVEACAFSPDGRYVLSGSRDGTLSVWDSEARKEVGRFFVGRSLSTVMFSPNGRRIAAGDKSGSLYLLRLVGFEIESPILTLAYLYRPGAGVSDSKPSAGCVWCGERFLPSGRVFDALHDAYEAMLSSTKWDTLSEPSLVSVLPAEAWTDPRLHSECAHCHQPLRFNPFIVVN